MANAPSIPGGYPLEPWKQHCERILLYETSSFLYLVGHDVAETCFHILKIDRRVDKPRCLSQILSEDPIVYGKNELKEMLNMISEGNRSSGGLVKVASAYGLVGFVKFLDCYYMTLIMQKKKVGCLAGNFIYTVSETQVFPIRPKDEPDNNAFKALWKKLNKKLNQTSAEIAEARYFGLFQFVDITKDFFFSYTYDLTHSLQHNFVVAKKYEELATLGGTAAASLPPPPTQDMFEWNYHQTEELRQIVGPQSSLFWVLPITFGSVQQRRFNIFGREMDLLLIARRSRHYAGTRYLKRGVSVHGKVANDCEIEQIVQLDAGKQASFCSYVQMRGSIPTYWKQETSVTMPKPPILINRIDPTYLATQVHFSDLLQRYGAPVIVLDLVKHQERRPREMLVGRELRLAVETLNSTMPMKSQIRYCALDSTKLSKSKKAPPQQQQQQQQQYQQQQQQHHQQQQQQQQQRGSVRAGKEWSAFETSFSGKDGFGTGAGVAGQAEKRGRDRDRTGSAEETGVGEGVDGGAAGAGRSGSVLDTPVAGAGGEGLDLFSELEAIAAMTIAETGLFVSDLSFLERAGFRPSMLAAAQARGYLEQSGVLRTNCIDCLDRTNVGQFVVGMKFLAVALRVLGLTSSKEQHLINSAASAAAPRVTSASIDPTSPLLGGLMDMYGELGDRIALQYGGSEAHKKGYGGHGTGGAASSKSGELLTSIKRYYSNAFTDTVKQDSMNVFLGCFVPSEQATPLWDLDSDYLLHNRSLHPPEPYLIRFVFNELLRDIKIILAFDDEEDWGEGAGGDGSSSEKAARLLVGAGDEEILRPPTVDLMTVWDRYLVRPSSHSRGTTTIADDGNDNDYGDGGTEAEGGRAATPEPLHAMMARASQEQDQDRSESPYLDPLDMPVRLPNDEVVPRRIVRSICRSERRKFAARLMETRMQGAVETWWRLALREHRSRLKLYVTPGLALTVGSGSGAGTDSGHGRMHRSYFDRVHRPRSLTLFDEVWATGDFLRAVDAVSAASAAAAAIATAAAETAAAADAAASAAASAAVTSTAAASLATATPNGSEADPILGSSAVHALGVDAEAEPETAAVEGEDGGADTWVDSAAGPTSDPATSEPETATGAGTATEAGTDADADAGAWTDGGVASPTPSDIASVPVAKLGKNSSGGRVGLGGYVRSLGAKMRSSVLGSMSSGAGPSPDADAASFDGSGSGSSSNSNPVSGPGPNPSLGSGSGSGSGSSSKRRGLGMGLGLRRRGSVDVGDGSGSGSGSTGGTAGSSGISSKKSNSKDNGSTGSTGEASTLIPGTEDPSYFYCDPQTLALYGRYAQSSTNPLSLMDAAVFVCEGPSQAPRAGQGTGHLPLSLLAPRPLPLDAIPAPAPISATTSSVASSLSKQTPSHEPNPSSTGANVALGPGTPQPLAKDQTQIQTPAQALAQALAQVQGLASNPRCTQFSPRAAQISRQRHRRILAQRAVAALAAPHPHPPLASRSTRSTLTDKDLTPLQRTAMKDYRGYLAESRVSCDDVAAMEQLSQAAHISTRVNSGVYSGIDANVSAVQCHAFLELGAVMIEEGLQDAATSGNGGMAGMGATGGSDPRVAPFQGVTAPTAIASQAARIVLEREGLGIGAGPSPAATAGLAPPLPPQSQPPSLPSHTLTSLLSKARAHGLSRTGLEVESVALAARYLHQQHAYARYLSYDRLESRWSFQTSDRALLLYCSQCCDGEAIADQLGEVLFVTAGGRGAGTGTGANATAGVATGNGGAGDGTEVTAAAVAAAVHGAFAGSGSGSGPGSGSASGVGTGGAGLSSTDGREGGAGDLAAVALSPVSASGSGFGTGSSHGQQQHQHPYYPASPSPAPSPFTASASTPPSLHSGPGPNSEHTSGSMYTSASTNDDNSIGGGTSVSLAQHSLNPHASSAAGSRPSLPYTTAGLGKGFNHGYGSPLPALSTVSAVAATASASTATRATDASLSFAIDPTFGSVLPHAATDTAASIEEAEADGDWPWSANSRPTVVLTANTATAVKAVPSSSGGGGADVTVHVPMGLGAALLVPRVAANPPRLPDIIAGLGPTAATIENQKESARSNNKNAAPTAQPAASAVAAAAVAALAAAAAAMTNPKKPQPSSPVLSLGSLGTCRDHQDDPSANTGNTNGVGTGAAASGSDSDSEDGSKSTQADTWDDEERFVPVLGSGNINTSGPGAACEYPGFVLLGPDLYARSHNPQMLMNEAGVRSFLRHVA